MNDCRQVCYSLARREIRDGDVLLFRRGDGLVGRAIAVAGRSRYSHVGMAGRWGKRLMLLETVQRKGGRAIFLSGAVDRWPGRIDVYSVIEPLESKLCRAMAVEAMIKMTGQPYGWPGLMKVALLHLPGVRWFSKPMLDDDGNGSFPFCSHAVARAYRAGGIDLVPNLADPATEPGDLARSAALQYRFTLMPDPKEESGEGTEESVEQTTKREVTEFTRGDNPDGPMQLKVEVSAAAVKPKTKKPRRRK